MTHPRRFGLLLVTCVGVLQVILVESSKSVSVASADDAGRNLALWDVGRANRIALETNDEGGLLGEFQNAVMLAEGRTRKHKNRSDPYGGGGDSGSSDNDNKKKNKKDGDGGSSSADIGISTMAKGIMAIMKERRHVTGGSDKSKGLYPKELRDRLFDRLDIPNKGDEDDRDTFRQAIERLVAKDLIKINKHGRVKLVISMDSSRSKRKDDDDDDDGDDDDDDDDAKDKQRDEQKDKVRDPHDAGTSNGDSGENERDDGKDVGSGNDGKEETGQHQDQQDSGGTNTDLLRDSDGDGYTDAEEILKGSDPNDASSTPRDPNGNGDDNTGSTGNGDGGEEGSGTNEDTTSGAGVGEECVRNNDCNSKVCGTDGICKSPDDSDGSSEPDGGGGEFVDPGESTGGTMSGSNGSACEMDRDCDTNVCVNNVCSRPKRSGESCDSPYDCLNGTCGKVSLSTGAESVCCETGKEERGVCTGQPDGSPCVLMSSSSPEATVTVVLDDVCASSYCNLNAGGVCDTLLSEETAPGSGGEGDRGGGGGGDGDEETTDANTNVMPTDPGDSEAADASAAGSSCDAGCIAAVTVPVSIFILIVVGATAYSMKKRRDEEGNVTEGEMEAPVGMVADDINDPMGSSHSNDIDEAQPLVASSAVAGGWQDGDSESEDIVYVDQEEAGEMGDYGGDEGDEEAPGADDVEEAQEEEDVNNERDHEEDWG